MKMSTSIPKKYVHKIAGVATQYSCPNCGGTVYVKKISDDCYKAWCAGCGKKERRDITKGGAISLFLKEK